MTASIEKYKFCKQVRASHLDRLAQARNENKALKEEAKAIIVDLEKKLKWSEDSRTSMAVKAAEQETCIEGLTAFLRDSERDVGRDRDELGHERNCCINIENNFNATLESSVKKEVVDALERARLEAKGRERKR